MIIGVRAHDYGKQPVDRLLCEIANDGWKTVQLAYPKAVEGVNTFTDVTLEFIKKTKMILLETGLTVAVLGVYVEPSLAEENARKKQVNLLLDALPQAKELGADCVGTETTAVSKQPHVSRDTALQQLRRSLAEILPEAERLGVNVAVEPVHHHSLNTPDMTRILLNEMASPRLKVIFDPINLLRPEDLERQEFLWAYCMDCFSDQIAAVHIKGASKDASDGILGEADFMDSVVDYQALFKSIRGLEVPILREKAVPAMAGRDISFIKSFL